VETSKVFLWGRLLASEVLLVVLVLEEMGFGCYQSTWNLACHCPFFWMQESSFLNFCFGATSHLFVLYKSVLEFSYCLEYSSSIPPFIILTEWWYPTTFISFFFMSHWWWFWDLPHNMKKTCLWLHLLLFWYLFDKYSIKVLYLLNALAKAFITLVISFISFCMLTSFKYCKMLDRHLF